MNKLKPYLVIAIVCMVTVMIMSYFANSVPSSLASFWPANNSNGNS